MAVRDPRPARARREEVLRQVLRRRHRPHKHQTIAMHIAQGEISVRRRAKAVYIISCCNEPLFVESTKLRKQDGVYGRLT